MQRILVSGIPKTKAVISSRITCGACEVIQTVYWPAVGSYWPIAPRGSIAVGIRRWLTSRCRTTTSAPSRALAVASASPHSHSMHTFPGAASWICGAPSSTARSGSTTTSSGSQSTSTSPSASSAASGVSATTAATAAPVNVTLSISSARGVATWFSTPPACQAHGSGLRCSKSLPVYTPSTPGAAAAALVSMPRMRACAYGERSTATCASPVSRTSSRKRAAPVIRRGSSTRLTGAPISGLVGSVAVAISPLSAHRLRRLAHGADDVLVAGAPAEVALERVANLVVARVGVPREQVGRGDDHPRRAEPALQAVLVPERLLDRVQLAVPGEPL